MIVPGDNTLKLVQVQHALVPFCPFTAEKKPIKVMSYTLGYIELDSALTPDGGLFNGVVALSTGTNVRLWFAINCLHGFTSYLLHIYSRLLCCNIKADSLLYKTLTSVFQR